ncbi:MAG: HK97 family phage prohead protease [Bacteroidetes bacterium]|nr:HK97 family phage prohead protease [Bacteroidota bacterium]
MDLKPFANEHSARIIEPSEFQQDSFRRINITIGIDAITGRLKGETTTTIQSYRFDKDKFTVIQSKKWLRDHDITWILFEPAEPKDMKIYKSNDTKVKDVDTKKGLVKAFYTVFGNIDSDKDIVEPGASAKTIRERGPEGSDRIKHFKWHDVREVPGRLQELGEDEFGGWFVSKMSNSTLGKDTLIQYQEGIISEHSFGFEIIKEDEDESGINHIREFKLWEVSSLTAWGANSLTRTDYVKDIKDEKELLKAIETITKYLQVGRFSDELLSNLEQKYTDLTIIYNSLITKEPLKNTQADEPDAIKQFYLNQLIKN